MKKTIYLLSIIALLISCSKNAEKIDSYQDALQQEELLSEIEKRYPESSDQITSEEKSKLDDEWNAQYEKTKEAYSIYLRDSINTPKGQDDLAKSRWTRRLNADQLEKVLNNAGDDFKQTPSYNNLFKRLENMKHCMPGALFRDFASKDPNGEDAALSNWVGNGSKYVLVDFWASWCPPCREEMPVLVELYEKYKDKGFEIVGYSLDSDANAWKAGLEKMNMTWPQMSDLAAWESLPVEMYAVQSIPCTYLFDAQGKIVEQGLRGDKLVEKIESLLK